MHSKLSSRASRLRPLRRRERVIGSSCRARVEQQAASTRSTIARVASDRRSREDRTGSQGTMRREQRAASGRWPRFRADAKLTGFFCTIAADRSAARAPQRAAGSQHRGTVGMKSSILPAPCSCDSAIVLPSARFSRRACSLRAHKTKKKRKNSAFTNHDATNEARWDTQTYSKPFRTGFELLSSSVLDASVPASLEISKRAISHANTSTGLRGHDRWMIDRAWSELAG